MMALSATATVSKRDTVISILGMKSPTIVSALPDKPNISYAVRDKGNIGDVFTIAEQVTIFKMSNATSDHILQEGRRMLPVVPILSFFNETGVYRTTRSTKYCYVSFGGYVHQCYSQECPGVYNILLDQK